MSAKHALLGLLLDRPAHPYQLAGRLHQRLGPAWEVNSGQVYQLVKRLEADGLIGRVQASSGEPEDRHVYEITDDGVGEFERWFHQNGTAVRLCRRPLLVKVTFAGPQRLNDALEKVDAYELECAQRLKEIAELRETLPGDGPLVRAEQLLLRLNLSADIFQLEGELRWASHAREILSWLAIREGPPPSASASASASEARRKLFQARARAQRVEDE
jgi:PadR family transcriptional regulator, regulatory protein AphA